MHKEGRFLQSYLSNQVFAHNCSQITIIIKCENYGQRLDFANIRNKKEEKKTYTRIMLT